MPLITITGYPTCGKTHRALQIASYFNSRLSQSPPTQAIRVHHITDSSLGITRDVYDLESKEKSERSNNASEKDARASVYAAVKRVLGPNDVVILDAAGGSYIKGWRYQLYCESKALKTPSVLVHVGAGVEVCRGVNEGRLRRRDEGNGDENGDGDGEQPYERDTWDNLVYRYEEPNGMTRWDSPLFTVLWYDETPPCEAIWEAVMGGADGKKVVVRPNQATVLRPSVAEGYLYELDRVTQEVVGRVVQWGKDHEGEGGGEVVICEGEGRKKGAKNASDEDDGDWAEVSGRLILQLPPNPLALPALQRLRRQFIALNRKNAVPVGRIRESFVGYLNGSFEGA